MIPHEVVNVNNQNKIKAQCLSTSGIAVYTIPELI